MAVFHVSGTTSAQIQNPTVGSPYTVLTLFGAPSIPDGIYRVGDPVVVSFGSNTLDTSYTFLGYEEGTRNMILDIVGSPQFSILFRTDPGSVITYTPGQIVTNEPFGVGVVRFADYGLRVPGSDVLNSQSRDIELDRGVYKVGDKVEIRRIASYDQNGDPNFESTVTAEFDGLDRETGDLLFSNAKLPDGSDFNNGRQIIVANVKDTTYTVPTTDIVAESWPAPDATGARFTNYGFRQGNDITNDVAFDLQGAGAIFGLDVDAPAGIHDVGTAITIRLFGGVAGGKAVDVTYIGRATDPGGDFYPIFEAADFDSDGDGASDGRAQFIGTNEAHGTDTYAPGTLVTDEPLGTGEVTFSNYAQRIDSEIGDGRFRAQSSIEVKFAHGVYEAGDPVMLDFEVLGQVATTLVGYESDTGNPVFQNTAGTRLYVLTREDLPFDSVYTVDNLVTDMSFRTGEATFSNYAFQVTRHIGNGAFQIQNAQGISGSQVRFAHGHGVYEAGDPITINIGGTYIPTTFFGYESDTGNPIFLDSSAPGERLFIAVNSNAPSGSIYQVDNVVTDAYTTCFAPGTLIATPAGERAVETLKPGDMVLTADGDTVPVRFVGFQKVPTLFGPKELTHPVRIRAGALGENTPHTDLVVTKDHGMIVDGVICHAGALINGTSIVEVPTAELDTGPSGIATYYHVETEGHVPLLANGAVAESFIDDVDRARFANHGEFVAMYGARVPAMTQMNLPRAMSARQVPPRIRTRLGLPEYDATVIIPPPVPSGVRRLWGACFRGLRDRARSAGRHMGIA